MSTKRQDTCARFGSSVIEGVDDVTDVVLTAMAGAPDVRLRQIMDALVLLQPVILAQLYLSDTIFN